MMIVCPKCKEAKQPKEFNKNSKRPNGLAAWCKACMPPKGKAPK